jgi:hypothetical protein
MAHYAFLDENNLVTEVIVGIDETETIEGLDPETWYGNLRGQVCKRTSYNANIRGVYAGIGMLYNESFDTFVPLQPYDSWVLNEDKTNWKAPIAYPTDGKTYFWNEEILNWQEVSE